MSPYRIVSVCFDGYSVEIVVEDASKREVYKISLNADKLMEIIGNNVMKFIDNKSIDITLIDICKEE